MEVAISVKTWELYHHTHLIHTFSFLILPGDLLIPTSTYLKREQRHDLRLGKIGEPMRWRMTSEAFKSCPSPSSIFVTDCLSIKRSQNQCDVCMMKDVDV